MLLAPAWSSVPVTRGVIRSASATFGAHNIGNVEVGAFVSTPSMSSFVSPASSIAARIAPTLCAICDIPGTLPNFVCPTPTMQ